MECSLFKNLELYFFVFDAKKYKINTIPILYQIGNLLIKNPSTKTKIIAKNKNLTIKFNLSCINIFKKENKNPSINMI